MGKGHETWGKKDREQRRDKAKKQQEEKKKERKENSQKGKGLDDMMAYIDEHGHISATPPDPSKRKEINVEDIEIGVPKQKPVDPADRLRTGTVSFFNNDKGYGFIKDHKSQESIFEHVNSCSEPI